MSDASARWCEHCRLDVHTTKTLGVQEFEALLERSVDAQVCMELELERGRPMLRAGLAAGVLVTALAACAPPAPSVAPSASAEASPELVIPYAVFIETAALEQESERSALRGFLLDEQGHAIAGAEVVLSGEVLEAPLMASSSELGQYGFVGLVPGDYELEVISELGLAHALVRVAARSEVAVSFRGPYEPWLGLVGAVVVSVMERKDGFETAGPYLVDQEVEAP